jgi:hypothetical protein
MKFTAISDATQHLQGRFFGFVEERTLTREPTPILFPPQKRWQWVKEKVLADGSVLIQYTRLKPPAGAFSGSL